MGLLRGSFAAAATAVAALAVAFPTTVVDAHGFMSNPSPVFADIYNKNMQSALMDGTPGPYTGSDEIRALAEKAGSKCGKTDPNGPAQPIPADGMVSFTVSAQHIGPCEIWLDDAKVVSANECWKEFPSKQIKVDFSKCAGGSCLLRWVWMATHNNQWEFFDNCVRIGSGGGGGGAAKTEVSTPAMTPAPLTFQAVETAAPGFVKPATETQPVPAGAACGKGKGGDHSLDDWCKANCAAGFCPPSHCDPC